MCSCRIPPGVEFVVPLSPPPFSLIASLTRRLGKLWTIFDLPLFSRRMTKDKKKSKRKLLVRIMADFHSVLDPPAARLTTETRRAGVEKRRIWMTTKDTGEQRRSPPTKVSSKRFSTNVSLYSLISGGAIMRMVKPLVEPISQN